MVAALKEAVGGLRKQQAPNEEHDCWDGRQPHREAPAPPVYSGGACGQHYAAASAYGDAPGLSQSTHTDSPATLYGTSNTGVTSCTRAMSTVLSLRTVAWPADADAVLGAAHQGSATCWLQRKESEGSGFSKFCQQSRALLLIRLGLTVIHELRNEDAGGGGQLEHEVEGAAQLGRRNL